MVDKQLEPTWLWVLMIAATLTTAFSFLGFIVYSKLNPPWENNKWPEGTEYAAAAFLFGFVAILLWVGTAVGWSIVVFKRRRSEQGHT